MVGIPEIGTKLQLCCNLGRGSYHNPKPQIIGDFEYLGEVPGENNNVRNKKHGRFKRLTAKMYEYDQDIEDWYFTDIGLMAYSSPTGIPGVYAPTDGIYNVINYCMRIE